MYDSFRSSKDQNGNRYADTKGLAHEVLVGIKDSTGNWTTGSVHYMLANNLSIFCLYPKTV